MGYGWAEARAMATEDSLWRHDAANHRQQVATCTRQRKMQAGACLQLYYKWNPARALAAGDSIRRAPMRREWGTAASSPPSSDGRAGPARGAGPMSPRP